MKDKSKLQAPDAPKDAPSKRNTGRSFPAPHNPFYDSPSESEAPMQFYTGTGKLIQPDPTRSVIKVEDDDKECNHLDPRKNGWVHPGLTGLAVDYQLPRENYALIEVPWYFQEHLEYIKGDPTKLARHANNETELGGLLTSAHSYAAADNESGVPVKWMGGSVAGGRFTSKRDQRGIVSQEGEALANLKKSVSEFYDVTDYLRQRYQEPLAAARANSLTLYRAVATGNSQQDTFLETLPSSTTFSLDFVKKWAGNKGRENYLIFEITVPVTHNMLSMAYPENYSLQFPMAMNQDQGEVTLAPTTMTRTGQRQEDGYTIVEVSARMMEEQEALDNIQSQSDHRGEDLTVQDIVPVFSGIKQFFSLATLSKKYEHNWAEWAPKITETASGTAFDRTVIFKHSDFEPELRVHLTMDQVSGAISIDLFTWEEDYGYDEEDSPAEEVEMYESAKTGTKYVAKRVSRNYTAKTVGDIFYVGMSGNLEQADEFETINWPDLWEEALQEEEEDMA